MEAEAFLTGTWKNYEELEESISMPELLTTLEAIQKKKWQDYRLQAALQGVDIPAEPTSSTEKTFDDIRREAVIRAQGGDPDANDVTDLRGKVADEVGFGVNTMGGVNYNVEKL